MTANHSTAALRAIPPPTNESAPNSRQAVEAQKAKQNSVIGTIEQSAENVNVRRFGHMAKHGAALLARGYLPVPVEPGGKKPVGTGWQRRRMTEADTKRQGACSAGLLTGQGDYPLWPLDLDIENQAVASAVLNFARKHLSGAPERVGKAPKTLLVLRAPRAGLPKRTSAAFIDPANPTKPDGRPLLQRIEVLGDGQQFVVFGVHEDTGRLYQSTPPLDQVNASALPVLPDSFIDELFAEFERLARAHGLRPHGATPKLVAVSANARDPLDAAIAAADREQAVVRFNAETLADIESALAFVDPNPRDNWVNVYQYAACMKGSEWEAPLRAVVDTWAARAENRDPEADSTKWDEPSITGERSDFRSIFALAQAAGWKNPRTAAVAAPEDFDVVAIDPNNPPAPAFKRNNNGEILPTIGNVVRAVSTPTVAGVRIGHDSFRDETMLARAGTDEWRSFTDADYVTLRMDLEARGFKPIGPQLMRDAVTKAADDFRFDSAILWLESLAWDGKSRVGTFLSAYCGADDNAYTRAVSEYLWTALAGRVLVPGVKADMVPIFVGGQGIGKSTALAAIAPSPEHFVEVTLDLRDDDLARRLRGRLVGEIAELRGLGSREIEAIKAFVTRTHEKWVPKYREFATEYPRRLVFIGTTNTDEFLDDETGNRRWLPVRVSALNVRAIREDHLQLWAEARELFKAGGVRYAAAQTLAEAEHAEFAAEDPWQSAIAQWLDDPAGAEFGAGGEPRGGKPITAGEVLSAALHLPQSQINKPAQMRVGKVLRRLGYHRDTRRVDGKTTKVWVRS